MSDAIIDQVVAQLKTLPEHLQQQVLTFVQTLKKSPLVGVPGKQLLPFAGAISLDDLHLMSQAIENECEQVDLNEW